jgi:hypothetical protein
LFTASTERRESVCFKERRAGPMARHAVVSPMSGLISWEWRFKQTLATSGTTVDSID